MSPKELRRDLIKAREILLEDWENEARRLRVDHMCRAIAQACNCELATSTPIYHRLRALVPSFLIDHETHHGLTGCLDLIDRLDAILIEEAKRDK